MEKIPKLNKSYWAMMLICTTMGELIGNLLSRNFELGYTQGALLDAIIFATAVGITLWFRLKNDIVYWLLILMGNIGGTNLADWVTLDPLENDKKWGFLQPLQLGTKAGSVAVATSLVVVLAVRYFTAKRTREDSHVSTSLYWVAILLSSTFGTTSGDFITNDTPLGALGGSVFLLVLLSLLFVAFKKNIVSRSTSYWIALVVMHPVGATLGNWVSKPIGLNLGNVYTNIFLAMAFTILYLRHNTLQTCNSRP